MASPNFDNTGYTTYVNSLTSTGWTTFASDMTTSFVGAFASRFALTTRQTNMLSSVPAAMQAKVIENANWCAAALSGGSLLNVEASSFDYNPTGPAAIAGPINVKVTFDVEIGIIPLSISFTAKVTITFS